MKKLPSRLDNNTFYTLTLICFFTLAGITILLTGYNKTLFFLINSISNYTGGKIWQWLTILGDGFLTAIILLLFINRKPEIVWSFFLATIIYMVILHSLKRGLDIKRPPGILPLEDFVLIGPKYKHQAFPSGHTTTIFALTQVIALHYRSRALKYILLLIAILVAISRIVVGLHWPLDICGGAVLGIFSGVIGTQLAKHSSWGFSAPAKIIFYFILVPGAIYMILFYETGYLGAAIFMQAIGVICLVYWVFDLLNYYKLIFLDKNNCQS